MSQNTISAVTVTNGTRYIIDDVSKSAVSVDNVRADVNMVHISLDDYSDKLVGGQILSNELYVISADYIEAYGQQMKNLAPGIDLSDAVNVEQLNTVSTLANYYSKSETSSATEISSAVSSISSILSGLEDILHEINTGSQS